METDAERIERIQREGREEQARLKALRDQAQNEASEIEGKPVFLKRHLKPIHSGPAWIRRDKIKALNRALRSRGLSASDREKLLARLHEVQTQRDKGVS